VEWHHNNQGLAYDVPPRDSVLMGNHSILFWLKAGLIYVGRWTWLQKGQTINKILKHIFSHAEWTPDGELL